MALRILWFAGIMGSIALFTLKEHQNITREKMSASFLGGVENIITGGEHISPASLKR